MPSGKRENYRVILLLDRTGRKTLDRTLNVCHLAMHHAVRHAMHRLETTKLVTPLGDFEAMVKEFTKDSHLYEETHKEIAQHACELYSSLVIAKAAHDPRKPHAFICAVPAKEVIFSTSGRQVKVPYLGVVNYRRNMFAVSSEGGILLPQVAHRVVLGYFSNEACIVLQTKVPKPDGVVIGDQKMVQVTASEIARRRKAREKADPENQEPK
jgi:hypothetical protein